MPVSISGKCWLPAVCLLLLANCAKHKLAPLGGALPSGPTAHAPVAAPPASSGSEAAKPEKGVAQVNRGAPGVNRLLLEPPRMSLSREGRVLRKDVPGIDKITVLVDAGEMTPRPQSEVTIQNALRALANQFLFLCPDRMRVGSAEDCRFTAKEGLNDFFRAQLRVQGIEASKADAVTILVHADLASPDQSVFDIHAASNGTSSGGQLWRVVPRNPGGHKLELRVLPTARILSAGDVQGAPVVLVHFVSVVGVDTRLNEYGPAVIGCLAALGLLAWLTWTLWRNARPSAFSSR